MILMPAFASYEARGGVGYPPRRSAATATRPPRRSRSSDRRSRPSDRRSPELLLKAQVDGVADSIFRKYSVRRELSPTALGASSTAARPTQRHASSRPSTARPEGRPPNEDLALSAFGDIWAPIAAHAHPTRPFSSFREAGTDPADPETQVEDADAVYDSADHGHRRGGRCRHGRSAGCAARPACLPAGKAGRRVDAGRSPAGRWKAIEKRFLLSRLRCGTGARRHPALAPGPALEVHTVPSGAGDDPHPSRCMLASRQMNRSPSTTEFPGRAALTAGHQRSPGPKGVAPTPVFSTTTR